MPKELENLRLEGGGESLSSFLESLPSESRPYLISATSECLRERAPLNEAEILGRCRRIRYAARAAR